VASVNVRYMVDDVAAAIAFYTTHLGFTLLSDQGPAFAMGGSPGLAAGTGSISSLRISMRRSRGSALPASGSATTSSGCPAARRSGSTAGACRTATCGVGKHAVPMKSLEDGALVGVRDRQTERIRHRVRRQLARRDLIQERREEVVVVAVDERDLGLARPQYSFEPPHQVEAGEPTADHDDRLRHQFGRPTADSNRASSCR